MMRVDASRVRKPPTTELIAAACKTIACTVPGLVQLQLDHLPKRLQAYSKRDDFCVGYVVGLLFHMFDHAMLPLDVPAVHEACSETFDRLYADDGQSVFQRATTQAGAAVHRFAAGARAGTEDAIDISVRGVMVKRLAREFSLPS